MGRDAQHDLGRGDAAEHVVHAPGGGLERALGERHHGVDGGVGAGAVGLELVERARGDEALERALVDEPRVHAPGEVAEVGERRFSARLDQPPDGLAADALDGGKRVADRPVMHVEIGARAVDRGRLDPDAEALRLAAEFAELVGVVERRASSTQRGTRPGGSP